MLVIQEYQCGFCAASVQVHHYLDAIVPATPEGWTSISPYYYVCAKHTITVSTISEGPTKGYVEIVVKYGNAPQGN